MLRHFYFGSTQNQKFRNGFPEEGKIISVCGTQLESGVSLAFLQKNRCGILIQGLANRR